MYRTACLLLAFAPLLANAQTPRGTWRVETSTQSAIVIDGNTQAGESFQGQEFIAFRADKTVSGTEWIISDYLTGLATLSYDPRRSGNSAFFDPLLRNKTKFATYRYREPNYRILFDVPRLNARYRNSSSLMSAPWLTRSGYDARLATALNTTVGNVTFTARITDYSHQGSMPDGNNIQGTVVLKAEITGTYRPTGQAAQTKSATLTLTTTYDGRRFAIKSSCCGKNPGRNRLASQAFLDKVATLDGIRSASVTSGSKTGTLRYLVLQEGSGPLLTDTNTADFSYRAYLPSGATVDAGVSEQDVDAAGLPNISSDEVAGLIEGLKLMSKGDKFRFFMPPALAYGVEGSGRIGPESALVVDVEVFAAQ